MFRIPWLIILCCLLGLLASCKNNEVNKGIARGIYDGMYQAQSMSDDETLPEAGEEGEERPSYEEYERQRR